MKAHVGAEISRSNVRRLLDLREPLVPSLSPKRPRPTPVGTTKSPTAPIPAVQPPAPGVPWYRRRLSWRAWLVGSLKLGTLLGFIVVCLSLPIDVAERLIAIYAIASLLYRIDSQRTFLIAILLLCGVVAWSVMGEADRAEGFAVYTFYFLVIGLVAALREANGRPKIQA